MNQITHNSKMFVRRPGQALVVRLAIPTGCRVWSVYFQ
jgi:hypothetical protein